MGVVKVEMLSSDNDFSDAIYPRTSTDMVVDEAKNKTVKQVIGELESDLAMSKVSLGNVSSQINHHESETLCHAHVYFGEGVVDISKGTISVEIDQSFVIEQGLAISVLLPVANDDAGKYFTLSVNSNAPIKICTSGGGFTGKWAAGDILNVRYRNAVGSETEPFFIMWGKGTNPTEYGTANSAHVLSGYTVLTSAGMVSGTILNNGLGGTITPTTSNIVKRRGYYSSDLVVVGDEDLIPANIRDGKSVFGVLGSYKADDIDFGMVDDADVLAGVTFATSAGLVEGTMANNGAGGTVIPKAVDQTKANGYYSSAITIKGDADLVASNIKSGVDIFGVVGSYTGPSITYGTAIAADVLASKTILTSAGVVQGTMVNRGAGGTVTPGSSDQSKQAGYYSSAITIKGDTDLVASNIKSGVDIFGVVGTYSGDAVNYGTVSASDVLSGKTFATSTGLVSGSMVNRGAGGTVTPGRSNQTKSAGYYSSDITISGDLDLVAGNIKNGVDIFGVVGTYTGDGAVTQTVAGTPLTVDVNDLNSNNDYEIPLVFNSISTLPKLLVINGLSIEGADGATSTLPLVIPFPFVVGNMPVVGTDAVTTFQVTSVSHTSNVLTVNVLISGVQAALEGAELSPTGLFVY